MKKLNFIVLLASAAVILGSCNGSSSNGNNTSEGNYIKRNILPGPGRYAAVSFTIGDSIAFVGTGNDGILRDSLFSDFYEYNVDSGSWVGKQIKSLPVQRQMAVAFSLNGKGYVGTGIDKYNGTFYNDFYSYDPATNNWTPIAPLPGPTRARATAFGLDAVNKGYVVGGSTDNNLFLSDVYAYDPTSNTWTPDQGLPFDKRAGASSFVLNGKGYVVGGFSGSNTLSPYFYQYDPTSANHWGKYLRQITTATDSSYDDTYINIERVDGVAMVIGGKVYLTTGASSPGSAAGEGIGSPNKTTWCWDPTTDIWEQRSDYERAPVWQGVGFSLKSRGFVGLGWSGGGSPSYLFDEFIPTQDLNLND